MYPKNEMARRSFFLPVLGGALLAAIAALLGGPSWLVLVLAAYGAALSVALPSMVTTFAVWRVDRARWSDSLVTERVADHAHVLARGVQRWVGEAADLVELTDATAAAQLRDEVLVLRERAAATLARWRAQASPESARAMETGYMGGLAMIAPPRSSRPLRRFATYQGTPRWLPRNLRGLLVQLLRGVDVVRLLHTPEIERRSLIVSLWLRAAFVAAAPLAAGASFTGAVPLRVDAGTGTDVIWAVVLAFAVATAVLAGPIADHTIGQPTRWRLYAAEQALTIAAVVSSPCWPIAIFGAGAVNWIERPDWTLRRLLAWMFLTYGALAIGAVAAGADASAITFEVLLGIAVTAVMAGSYGLMLPATVATFVGALVGSMAWRSRAFLAVRRDRDDADRVIDKARASVSTMDARDPRVSRVLAGLSTASARLDDPRQLLERRPRALAPLCSRAMTAIVPPEGHDVPPDGAMRSAPIASRPLEVRDLVLRSGRVARRLERLLKRVALEAVDNDGRDVLFCHIGLLDTTRVLITIGNGLPSPQPATQGFQTGEAWLHRWRTGIPECRIIFRDECSGDPFDLAGNVFLVQLTIGTSAFQPPREETP